MASFFLIPSQIHYENEGLKYVAAVNGLKGTMPS